MMADLERSVAYTSDVAFSPTVEGDPGAQRVA